MWASDIISIQPHKHQPGVSLLPPMERAMGIEPTSSAWKAEVLPLNYARATRSDQFQFGSISFRRWRGEDSNLRRLSQQIYSLPPLAAREPLRSLIQFKRTIVLYLLILSIKKMSICKVFACTDKGIWSPQRDSNPPPDDYKSTALPNELCGHKWR